MRKILLVMGVMILILPIGIRCLENQNQEDVVATYERKLDKYDDRQMRDVLSSAQEYNQRLYETNVVDLESYVKELDLSGNGMMGSIQIPKINLKLPLYHGTEESVLSQGVGHVKESSLPAGGINSHCVLSGHRGVPGAQLFTRLDELKLGDEFYIHVCRQKLCYKVCDIQVVEPNEIGSFNRKEGKDLVSLVTCTPYGINTHRLVVTGERLMESQKEGQKGSLLSDRDLAVLSVPMLFILIAWFQRKRNGGK